MAEHEQDRTEQRRTEGNSQRRYGRGGRQGGRQHGQSQQGHRDSQTGYQSEQGGGAGRQTGSSSEYAGPQSTGQFGRPTSSQSDLGTGRGREGQFQQSGGQARSGGGAPSGGQTRRTGGQMGGQTSRQTGSQMGGRTGHQTTQMGGQQGRSPISPVTVRDVAATDVVTVRPDAPITELVQQMSSQDVGAVVVVEGDRPVGIVTDRKIALALGETQDVSRMRTSDLMSEELFTVSEDTSIFELTRRLGGKGVRRVPVVGDGGDLRGIVSLDDIVVLLAEEFYNVSQIVRKQSPRF